VKKVTSRAENPSARAMVKTANPQYDNRMFIELQVQYLHENSKLKPGENMLCTEIVSDIQNFFLYTTCSSHVLQKEELLT
jgi:hypothetical protein